MELSPILLGNLLAESVIGAAIGYGLAWLTWRKRYKGQGSFLLHLAGIVTTSFAVVVFLVFLAAVFGGNIFTTISPARTLLLPYVVAVVAVPTLTELKAAVFPTAKLPPPVELSSTTQGDSRLHSGKLPPELPPKSPPALPPPLPPLD